MMEADFKERRSSPRVSIFQIVRIRPFDPSLPLEYCTTVNVSQCGLYFATTAGHYVPGMNVYVTSDFQPGSPIGRSSSGAVVRVETLENEKWGVAIRLF